MGMDANRASRGADPRSPDASSADAAVSTSTLNPAHPEERLSNVEEASRRTGDPPERIGWIEGHLPDIVDPLTPQHPETALTATRNFRHDGWTPEIKRRFLERFAECGVIVEACEAAAMSARSVYNLADRDPLFAAGMEAARVLARPKLADEGQSRALNGVVERIYKDGIVVAERHRYDNKLTMSVLARLDARIDRAEEKGSPHLSLVARRDDFLAALEEDRGEDGLALLGAPTPAATPGAEVHTGAGDHELHELRPAAAAAMAEQEADPLGRDCHDVWEDDEGWWTDYPPPTGFDGEEEGEYGDENYRRTLSAEEQAVIDADVAEEEAADRALGEAQRNAYFGFSEPPCAGDSPQ